MPLHYLATFIDQEYGSGRTIGAATEPSVWMLTAGAFGGLEGGFGGGMRDLWYRLFFGLAGHPDELQGAITNIGPDVVRNRCVRRWCGWKARPHDELGLTAL